MLFSRTDILENLGKGTVILLLNKDQLKSISYHVRIGPYYYKREVTSETHQPMFNPFDPETVARHFGEVHVAQTVRLLPSYIRDLTAWAGIDPDDYVILIQPGKMILGHTLEFVSGREYPPTGRCFTAKMKTPTSIGRM